MLVNLLAALQLFYEPSLSPTLFGLYIDDLPAAVLREAGADLPRLNDGWWVPPLLYADNLVLMATSAAGLQAQLDKLEAVAYAWGKVMVESMQRRRPQGWWYCCPCPQLHLRSFYAGTCGGVYLPGHARQGFVYAAGPRAEKGRKAKSCMRRRCAELGLQSVDSLRSLLGVRRSAPELVVVAETA